MWKYIGGGAASEKRRPSTGASLIEYIRKIKVCGPRLFEDAVENIPSKSKQEGDGIVTSGPSSASVHDPLLRGSPSEAESGCDASVSETASSPVAVTTPPTATPAVTASSPVTTSAPAAPVPRHSNASLHEQPSTPNSTIDVNKPGSILGEFPPVDYDSLYEDEDGEEGINMEGHGYIIQHLISQLQVKIGMDLTKVVLPTFILERRSLLEMYADFFAHPDLFVSIADHDDPRDRMVQVLKWYLSAFHAGRKSEVAKKPYNPIIGEVFKCYWDVPGREKGETYVKDGPVPYATANQLSFIAEQVSHHPPISAFYAEHKDKNISFCGHIWTKSKFLGLSVCVQNIGQGCVCLIDRNEEYIVHFPSGYGRSILTVPWVELGGSCQITCSKTGYNAQIEFCTKPFYGGKKHRVTAEVFSPGEKKAFLNVDGEWNGAITAKWNDGRTENFVDTTTTPIIKKNAKPVVEQDDNESRRLWLDVTYGLKFNQIARATAGKCMLEQKQRDEAKERKENDEAWEQKLFTAAGDNWVYNSPLQKRIDAQAGV